jgi:hypothetical protein
MPSGVNAFEISDIQEEKLMPDQPDNQDVTMLHCAEKPRDTVFLRSTAVLRSEEKVLWALF